MRIIDGKIVKCLVFKSDIILEDLQKAQGKFEDAGYTRVHSALRIVNDGYLNFDYYLPSSMVSGGFVQIPLGGKKVIFLDDGYLQETISSGSESVNYVDWLFQVIKLFESIEGPSTMVVPIIEKAGKIWVVDL